MSEKLYEVAVVEDEESSEGREVLEVRRSGKLVRQHYDHGEPEDNSFCRDWDWVAGALEQAYAFGLSDGAATVRKRCATELRVWCDDAEVADKVNERAVSVVRSVSISVEHGWPNFPDIEERVNAALLPNRADSEVK